MCFRISLHADIWESCYENAAQATKLACLLYFLPFLCIFFCCEFTSLFFKSKIVLLWDNSYFTRDYFRTRWEGSAIRPNRQCIFRAKAVQSLVSTQCILLGRVDQPLMCRQCNSCKTGSAAHKRQCNPLLAMRCKFWDVCSGNYSSG